MSRRFLRGASLSERNLVREGRRERPHFELKPIDNAGFFEIQVSNYVYISIYGLA